MSGVPGLFHLTISSSILVATNDRIPSFLIAEYYSIVYMYHIFLNLLIHRRTLRLFPLLVYCDWCCNKHGRADVSITYYLISFRHLVSSEIAGSYGRSIFNFLKNLQTIIHNDYTALP
jgi:hypothetical protein